MELTNDNQTAPVGALAVTHVSVAPAQPIALPAGTRLGRYEIIRVLGRGGMGQVYVARDVALGRRVAIKFMRDDRAEFVERFMMEARATARCQHENIVVIHEIGDHHGHGFMVLEYLEGETLAATIAAGPHPVSRAVELLLPVARALHHAHSHGLVHRDLKPENVFVTTEGAVKVLDFGIAAAFDAEPQGVALGATHTIVGTPLYMAPEQHLCLPTGQAADQWAFGHLLHELVTGHHLLGSPPPPGALTQVIAFDRRMPSAASAGAPSEVAAVIDRCLRKRPEDRFPTTRALLDALEAIQPQRDARDLRPFPGLAAFTDADADVYFGRSADVRRALGRLREQPVLAVVGPSGVGKSSFVRAGLGRALASEEPWEVIATRPGRAPLASLVELLAKAGGPSGDHALDAADRLRAEPGWLAQLLRERAARTRRKVLLFIDQLEELFTQDAAIEDRAAYVACIDAIADDLTAPLRLVLAMRSDFLDRVAEHGELMARVARSLLFLSPLDRGGLREALTQPVRLAGYQFESDAVVDDVLDAIEHAPSALPLLQFVAERMWDARDRDGRKLTADAYRGMGGVAGAMATHADQVIAELPPDRRRTARALFLRLVTPEKTRAIVEVRELAGAGDIAGLIDVLVAARLLVTSGDGDGRTIEIIHDALITGWPALATWIAEEHEVVAFVGALRPAAARWVERGRSPTTLWQGDELAHARRLRPRITVPLAAREREFLDASEAASDREVRRRRWLVATAVIVLAVVATTAMVAAIWIRGAEGKARAAAERARDRAREALAARDDAAASAERARAAEQARGVEVDRREAAEVRAATEIASKDQDLTVANQRLTDALEEQQREAALARTARTAAEAEAARAQRAERVVREKQTALEALLAERDARVKRLEQQLKKISTELR